ncbi:MAG TPA: MGMT family protein [Pyrinomonadaceae bacterium]|jgi:methylated-DNA-protein-cysteine methyltransferase-like protein
MDESTKDRSKPRLNSNAEASAAVETEGYRERVYEIVRRIPAGRVMTYGQIAEMLGEGYTARTVGFVMHADDEEATPWQRVINSQGACSTGRVILPPDKQQRLLEAEGIVFDARGRCDLSRYRWIPEEEEEARRKEERKEAQQSLFSD